MKLIQKFLYLLTILITMFLLLLAGTAGTQLIISAVSEKIGIAITNDFLYHVSGNIGTALAGITLTAYAKKKKYIRCAKTAEPFHFSKLLVYMGLALFICRIVTDVITTLLPADSFPMIKEQTMTNTSLTDVLLSVFFAPIFEELLFRMGLYNLLLQKFSRTVSLFICALLFAVIHGYQLQGLISCLIAGLVFTFIYDNTGNILYCIGAHGICNLFSHIMNTLKG